MKDKLLEERTQMVREVFKKDPELDRLREELHIDVEQIVASLTGQPSAVGNDEKEA